MGGLAHYLEEEGIPTTQISLVLEHTEAIQPPRALWVPFEFGRPLGSPDDAGFQTRVLRAAIRLLDAPAGPVLESFPEEPADDESELVWACPIPIGAATPDRQRALVSDELPMAFLRELAELLPWYDRAVRERKRTTVGVSGIPVESLGAFIAAFLGDALPSSPAQDLPIGLALKLAVDDLKALYFEAVTAQPAERRPGSAELADWFWGETDAGRCLLTLRSRFAESEDPILKLASSFLIVPVVEAHRSA